MVHCNCKLDYYGKLVIIKKVLQNLHVDTLWGHIVSSNFRVCNFMEPSKKMNETRLIKNYTIQANHILNHYNRNLIFRHWIDLHQFCYNNKDNIKSYLLNCISQFNFESAYIFRIERPFPFQLDLNENVGKSIQKGIFAKRKGSCNGEICCYLEINQENWTYILCKKIISACKILSVHTGEQRSKL